MAYRPGKRAEAPEHRRIRNKVNNPDSRKPPARKIPGYDATNRGTSDDSAVVQRCRGSGGRRRGRGPTHSRATILAWLPAGPPGRSMSLVPRRSSGADRQSSSEPGCVGRERLSHLLVRTAWAGQRCAQHLGGRRATTGAATTAAGPQFLPDPAVVSVIR
jgi:hypothetical protein